MKTENKNAKCATTLQNKLPHCHRCQLSSGWGKRRTSIQKTGQYFGVSNILFNFATATNSKRTRINISQNMAKKNNITVKDVNIRTMNVNGVDYICITDIARQKNEIEPKDVVKNWMRQKNTLEYLGLWERLYNPNFKGVEFDPLLAEAGSNSFTMSPTRWVELTAATGIITKNGAGGGTYAQRDIAFKFANWVSVEFELYLVKEFQRLKAEEQKLIGWTAKRELSKINYRIHTDAIKSHLIPEEVTKEQANIIYAEEADVLNVAMFGMTAKQWREANPELKGNIRDYATINELICLSNMENINAVLINDGMPQGERLVKLNQIAIQQMQVLEGNSDRKLLK